MGQDPLTSNQLNTFKLFIHQINLINEFIIFALKRINISRKYSGFCINEYGRSSFSSKLLIFFFSRSIHEDSDKFYFQRNILTD